MHEPAATRRSSAGKALSAVGEAGWHAGQPKGPRVVVLPRDNEQNWTEAMNMKLLLTALVSISLGLSACATVKGAGKDIQSVGQAGEDAINK